MGIKEVLLKKQKQDIVFKSELIGILLNVKFLGRVIFKVLSK
jgi:hypothetical protein